MLKNYIFRFDEEKSMKRRTALTIAGSDSSGGAGIQADIKTMIVNGVYAMSAVTALTAQNTMGVTAVEESTPEFLAAQIDAVFTDIRPDAVKIGMVSSGALIRVIAAKLAEYKAENIVVDPVMVATSGAKLISEEGIEALSTFLLPAAAVITPNIPEAQILTIWKRLPAEFMTSTAAACSARGDISLMTPTTSSTTENLCAGSEERESIIQTPMEPAARFPAPSLPIWPKGRICLRLWSGPKNTCPARWRQCWIWAEEAVPWITVFLSIR